MKSASKRGRVNILEKGKPFLGLLAIFLAGILLSPKYEDGSLKFLSEGNLSNILRQVSNNGILAVGMTFVILIAGIDLSVGTMMALGSTLTAMLIMNRQWTVASTVTLPCLGLLFYLLFFFLSRSLLKNLKTRAWKTLLSAAAGAAACILALLWALPQVHKGFGVLGVLLAVPSATLILGSISGLIIAKGKLQPFIVTLAMMTLALGSARLIAGEGHSVWPVYFGPEGAPETFQLLRERILGIVPVPGIFFLTCVFAGHFVLKKLQFGRHIFAIGGNEETARLSGILVDRAKIIVFGLSGFLAGLTGVLYCAQYRQGKPDAGTGNELDAIAAVVIGGTSLMGGKGSILGTLIGVLIFGFLNNILQLNGVHANVQLVLKGAIIVAAVLLQEGSFQLWFRQIRSKIRR